MSVRPVFAHLDIGRLIAAAFMILGVGMMLSLTREHAGLRAAV